MTCCSNNCQSDAAHEEMLEAYRRQRNIAWEVEAEQMNERLDKWIEVEEQDEQRIHS